MATPSCQLIFVVRRLPTLCQSKNPYSSLVRSALRPQKFSYVDQLTNYMKTNFILHEPGRFLIVPKPYGVSCIGSKQEDGGVFADGVHEKKDQQPNAGKTRHAADSVTVSDCIPSLARLFREPKLSFCVGLKRYLSGAIVLPASQIEFDNMKKSIKHASRNDEDSHYRALALLLGSPPDDEGTISGYSTFQAVGGHKEYVFVPGRAKRRAKSGKFAVEGSMDYRVLETRHGCSLVEFTTNKFARHLPRLMFSHLLCPILGDSMYCSRLIEVDGRPALINPAHHNRNVKLWFPPSLSARLDSSPAELHKSMPLFCHVFQTVFPQYGWMVGRPKSEQDVAHLVAASPPPPHFLAMAEVLELDTALSRYFRESSSESEVENNVGRDTVY